MQINNKLIDETTFVDCLNILYPAIQTVSESFFWAPSYYEVTVSLTYLIFATQKVDFAIIEVWCGGLFDGTNVVNAPKYCIITKQWYDHMEIVGESMTEITRNDAGIITPQSIVITLQHAEPVCNDIIDYRCRTQWSKKIIFDPRDNLYDIHYGIQETTFNYHHTIIWDKLPTTNPQFLTNLVGPFHLENIGLALTAFFTIIGQERLNLDHQILREILQSLRRKGRFDLIHHDGKQLLLDGAHNPQKMQALINALTTCYPTSLFTFYIAFKRGKQRQEMIDIIIPYAREIIIGDFVVTQDAQLHSVEPTEIFDYIASKWYTSATFDTDIRSAIWTYEDADNPLIITGSLYFLSCIYMMIEEQ
jgi:dihydrofolate synthase/folylpolyglutamate synthase